MTTIVAVETPAGITFAFDSLVSDGTRTFETPQQKVIHNHGVTYGVAGNILAVNLITHSELPTPSSNSGAQWVTLVLAPALAEVLTDLKRDDGYGTIILAAVNGRIYDFGTSLEWTRDSTGRYAIGSGAQYAFGALSAGATPLGAVEIAKTHDSGTGGTIREVRA